MRLGPTWWDLWFFKRSEREICVCAYQGRAMCDCFYFTLTSQLLPSVKESLLSGWILVGPFSSSKSFTLLVSLTFAYLMKNQAYSLKGEMF